MTFMNQLTQHQSSLQAQIEQLQAQRDKLPSGELLCIQNGPYTKWYESNGITPVYIPKKNQHYAEALALQKYCTRKLEELSSQLALTEQYIEALNHIPQNSDDLLNHPSYQTLIQHALASCFDGRAYTNDLRDSTGITGTGEEPGSTGIISTGKEPGSIDIHAWLTQPYQSNTRNPEHRIHKTISGHFVRSKSEVMIANCLFLNRIPYRYECALELEDVTLFPDFTILHPDSHQIFYWEHFGMMEQSAYCDQTYSKLKLYSRHNIIPTLNLITTYETKSFPIDSGKIQKLVQEYFL